MPQPDSETAAKQPRHRRGLTEDQTTSAFGIGTAYLSWLKVHFDGETSNGFTRENPLRSFRPLKKRGMPNRKLTRSMS